MALRGRAGSSSAPAPAKESRPAAWMRGIASSTRHLGDPGHVLDLGRAQRVDDQLRERLLDGGEVLLVVLDAVVRVVAALEHDLRAAEFDGLRAAAQDVVEVAGPALGGVLGRGVEGAELARRDAHVGVVDVPLDDVRRDVLGARVPAAAYGVGGGAQRVQRRVAVEVERLLRGDPPALRRHGRGRTGGRPSRSPGRPFRQVWTDRTSVRQRSDSLAAGQRRPRAGLRRPCGRRLPRRLARILRAVLVSVLRRTSHCGVPPAVVLRWTADAWPGERYVTGTRCRAAGSCLPSGALHEHQPSPVAVRSFALARQLHQDRVDVVLDDVVPLPPLDDAGDGAVPDAVLRSVRPPRPGAEEGLGHRRLVAGASRPAGRASARRRPARRCRRCRVTAHARQQAEDEPGGRRDGERAGHRQHQRAAHPPRPALAADGADSAMRPGSRGGARAGAAGPWRPAGPAAAARGRWPVRPPGVRAGRRRVAVGWPDGASDGRRRATVPGRRRPGARGAGARRAARPRRRGTTGHRPVRGPTRRRPVRGDPAARTPHRATRPPTGARPGRSPSAVLRAPGSAAPPPAG